MNRVLVVESEISADGTVTLHDARAKHILETLRVVPGASIASGTINGLAGVSRVLEVTAQSVRLRPEHDYALPEPWFDLLMAVPRPKALKRLWPQLAALGVGRIVLLRAAKVEKCYFSSQWLQERHYRPLLLDGLMQCGTTRLPEVMLAPRFKPFIEDELEKLFPDSLRLVAHPGERCWPVNGAKSSKRPLLALGPEGGWTAYEIEMLLEHGFLQCSLGSRVLRSDTACIALIAVLDYLCR